MRNEKCTYCIHKNDDFDCHNFCVPYDFDHYKAKAGDRNKKVTPESLPADGSKSYATGTETYNYN